MHVYTSYTIIFSWRVACNVPKITKSTLRNVPFGVVAVGFKSGKSCFYDRYSSLVYFGLAYFVLNNESHGSDE